jgi:hypothetical protein
MQGFCDQIARQYDTLVTQTQIESTTSSENSVTPTRTDLTVTDSWLELGEYNDEPIVPTNNESGQSVPSGMTISELRYSIEIYPFLVESVCAATEENNKKNATSEASEQRILIENDMNSSVPNISSLNILTAAQSSPNINLPTPTTINLANIPIIDDETNPPEQQQQKQTDDGTTSDEDDDEQMQLKRLKTANEQIEAPVEEDEDEDEEQQEEVRRFLI